MAVGHGGVAGQQQHPDGLAEDGAAADHDGVAPGGVDVVGVEQAHDAAGCAGREPGLAEGHRGEGVHGDAVDVLGGVDGFEHLPFVDLGRHGCCSRMPSTRGRRRALTSRPRRGGGGVGEVATWESSPPASASVGFMRT